MSDDYADAFGQDIRAAVDEVEQIRGLIGVGKLGITAERSLLTPLRIVDQQRAIMPEVTALIEEAKDLIADAIVSADQKGYGDETESLCNEIDEKLETIKATLMGKVE